jgi:hypothetical protein
MRVELTFVIRHHDRPLALSRAIDNALKAGLTRPQTTRCARGGGAWIVDVAGHVRETASRQPGIGLGSFRRVFADQTANPKTQLSSTVVKLRPPCRSEIGAEGSVESDAARYARSMEFEWDSNKEDSNLENHGSHR